MKRFLFGLLIISFGSSAFADCRKSYERASHNRDVHNEIIVGASIIGTGAGAILIPAANAIFVAGYMLTLTAAWPVTDFKRQGDSLYNNNFDKLLIAFGGAKSGIANKHLNKIISKSIKIAGLDQTPETEADAKTILVNGFEDETFCPVVKTRRDGSEKRSVFNRLAVIDYVSLNLKH